ncbi:MAG: ArsA family ATPase [Chloroflexus sp.]|jgi:arsenite-transporting ATPase|uniref:ArsA family ATPase n=1 Tax=Chloroflexus sp. Y-396-1 TaxID=867845 RepID=UPI00048EAFD3|nr:ArsA family ATPase [Chloroflexus sp. Y-396-1]MBO9311834.1 ArsA family ATPase [Chloroflexus sp.]MBO9314201.1 ArsA family ATPase [Chloroflexus sp.]MBO9338039.1 ArsA family ATPase [Chloroflexus sp.]
MRILFYTGKGGVGKTSVAAASALRCAQLGYRTIVLSTDAAHSLGDSLGVDLRAEPLQVAPNLWAQEINALHELESSWGTVSRYLADLLAWQGVETIAQGELSVIPGTEELFSLLQIKRHYDEGKYDVIVVDAAPTGETLRLLSLPDVMRWWIARLFPIARALLRVVRPVARRVTDMPIADDDVLASAQQAIDALIDVRQLLTNHQICTARIVMNLEKMVIREAQRSLTYLSLFGYAVDAIIVNRILPPDVDAHFAQWRAMQQQYAPLVEEMFEPLPILRAPHFSQEIVGTELLNELADHLFADRDPTTFLYQGPTQRVEKTAYGYDLIVPLPFASEDQVHLAQSDDELLISVGWHRHRIVLPQSLARLRAQDAFFEDSSLRVIFRRDVAA